MSRRPVRRSAWRGGGSARGAKAEARRLRRERRRAERLDPRIRRRPPHRVATTAEKACALHGIEQADLRQQLVRARRNRLGQPPRARRRVVENGDRMTPRGQQASGGSTGRPSSNDDGVHGSWQRHEATVYRDPMGCAIDAGMMTTMKKSLTLVALTVGVIGLA